MIFELNRKQTSKPSRSQRLALGICIFDQRGDVQMMDLRYPIGLFNMNQEITSKEINQWTSDIESAPQELKKAVKNLNDLQLDTPTVPAAGQ